MPWYLRLTGCPVDELEIWDENELREEMKPVEDGENRVTLTREFRDEESLVSFLAGRFEDIIWLKRNIEIGVEVHVSLAGGRSCLEPWTLGLLVTLNARLFLSE